MTLNGFTSESRQSIFYGVWGPVGAHLDWMPPPKKDHAWFPFKPAVPTLLNLSGSPALAQATR